MNNLLMNPKIQLFHNVLSKIIKTNNRKQSAAVDLAHQVYGQLGSGTPIIIVHGILGSKRNWQSVARKINASTNLPVIAVDMRNHGESPHVDSHKYSDMVADVSRLMESLGLEKTILIGHSMGGRVSMVFSLTQPHKISRLVVADVSPVTFPTDVTNFLPNLIEAMSTVVFDVDNVSKGRAKARKELVKSGIVEEDGTLDFILLNVGKRNGKIGWKMNLKALKKYFKDISSFPSELAGKKFDGPTLFIAGSRSNFVPPSDLKGIQGFFPKAELKFVNAGHNVHIDQTEEFVSLVSQFVKSSLK